jgi:uncharacterized protein YxjI
MRYQMQQKVFSFSDKYAIRDESEAVCYFAAGKVFSLADQFTLLDKDEKEVARISQKLLSFGSVYEITRPEKPTAMVRKHLFEMSNSKFTVEIEGEKSIEAKGNFMDTEYTFKRGDDVVSTVSKQWFRFANTYGIDIVNGENPVLLLGAALVIDLC